MKITYTIWEEDPAILYSGRPEGCGYGRREEIGR